jgi:predicted transposase/invertase (TIGR01784 family)
VAKNLSGSKASRTAIFDLHCKDDAGDLIEIEVQIREVDNFMKRLAFYASEMVANQAEPGDDWNFNVQPTYVIALTRFPVFPDERAVHRGTVIDLESGEQLVDTYNFTAIELSKVPFFIEKTSSDLSKWLFFFRYLNRLKELPEELNEEKFKDLTESAKVSKFSKKEFEAYRNMYHKIWDHNALRKGFFKEFAEDINAKIEDRTREIAKNLIKLGVSDEKVVAATGLSLEDVVVLRSQLEM